MNKKIVLKNIISSLIFQLIALIYGFVVPKLIIEQYGSEVSGLTSSIVQFLSYIMLLEAGIGPVIKNELFKPIVENDNQKIQDILGASNRFFRRIAYIFLLYICVLCIFYPRIVCDRFDFLYTLSLIIIISISTFFEYFLGMTYKLFLQADQKNYLIDYVSIFTYIITLITIIVLIKFNLNIQIVKFATAVLTVIRPVFLKIYFNKVYNLRANRKSKYVLQKKWDGLSHHIASVVQSNTDTIVLTLYDNLINVSIYSVYYLVINGVRAIIVSLTNGIDAFFGKLMVEGNRKDISNRFNTYSTIFFTLTTVILSCTIVLIVPFVKVYTSNITDANYILPCFAYILVFAEFLYVIRYPFSTIVYAKGHFRQTRIFSLIEPIVNIILSILFVKKFGLIGVAFGTALSMPIRSFGFIIYASTRILEIPLKSVFKKVFVSFFELLLVLSIYLLIGNYDVNSYFQWIQLALLCGTLILTAIILINFAIFKNDFNQILNLINNRRGK